MSWEEGEKERRWTRREWVRLGMLAGTVGALGGLGGLVTGQLLPPPVQFNGEIRETITYTKFDTPQWWNSKDGQPVKVTDFQLWDGATGVWRGLFQDNQWIPGTGFPVIIIRVPINGTGATQPSSSDMIAAGIPALPAGFDLAYEDAATETRIEVFFDRCVHLCCYPGWHVVTNPPPDYGNYLVPPPTHAVYGKDPIYCICHGSQYDPLLLTIDRNPKNGAHYVGAQRVHGPAPRALPLIPVKEQGGNLVGGMADARWYVYC
jgi:Rieske Fe-S protein